MSKNRYHVLDMPARQERELVRRLVDVTESTFLAHTGDIHVHGQAGPDYFIHRDGTVSVLVPEPVA